MNESLTDRIAAAFCDCSLPKQEWTHHAHLRVGLWHRMRYSADESLERLREGIRRYNVACGVANTESSGYHETITQASLRAAVSFLARNPDRPLFVTCNSLIQSTIGRPEWLLEYWSRCRLFSAEARREWLEPDLAAFPYP